MKKIEISREGFELKAENDKRYIFYRGVRLWEYDSRILKDEEFSILDDSEFNLGFTLMVLDKHKEMMTYGRFSTLGEIKDWLDNPISLF